MRNKLRFLWAIPVLAMSLSFVQAQVPDPIVFVSRQIPTNGSIYMPETNDMPGVGARSRFRLAAPGKLLVRETNGTIRTLIDGSTPAGNAFHLIDVNAPDVSYDGSQIAFAGLPNGTYDTGPEANPGAWRIYVINVDGTGLRQVTTSNMNLNFSGTVLPFGGGYAYDDTDPCWLPDGRLVLTSTRWPSYGQYSGMRTSNLYVVNADGTNLHRITAERNGSDRPVIDPITGKIAYARWWRNHRFPVDSMDTVLDSGGNLVQKEGLTTDRDHHVGGANHMWRNSWHLATINPDGTGLAQWGGPNHLGDEGHVYGGAFTDAGVFIGNFFPMPNMTEAAGFGGLRLLHRGGGDFQGLIGITSLTLNYVKTNPDSFGIFVPDANGYVSEPAVLSDGTLIVSRTKDYLQDYGLYTMNADGTGLDPNAPLVDFSSTSELQAMAIRDRRGLKTPILTDNISEVPSLLPPGPNGPYDQDGMFTFDAMNVFSNDAVDKAVAAAPGIGTIANIKFFIDHQRSSPGSFPAKDWPILLGELPVNKDGSVQEQHAPANVPLFEQLRSPSNTVPILDGSVPHVAGMNFGRPGAVARCVGCHSGHTMIKLPATRQEALWTNLAPGASVTVSSTMDANQNRGLVDLKVNNGPIYSYWRSASGQNTGQWVLLTFPVDVYVRTVRLYNPRQGDVANSSIHVNHASVRLFADAAATQELVVNGTDNVFNFPQGADVPFSDVKARAVKVELDNVTGTFYGAKVASLAEVEVIAAGFPTPVITDNPNGGTDGTALTLSTLYSYPNPVVKKNIVTFHVEASGADELTINIYNDAWEKIKEIHMDGAPAIINGKSVYEATWDLSGVPSGTYGYTARIRRGSEAVQRFNKLAVVK